MISAPSLAQQREGLRSGLISMPSEHKAPVTGKITPSQPHTPQDTQPFLPIFRQLAWTPQGPSLKSPAWLVKNPAWNCSWIPCVFPSTPFPSLSLLCNPFTQVHWWDSLLLQLEQSIFLLPRFSFSLHWNIECVVSFASAWISLRVCALFDFCNALQGCGVY